MYVPRYMFFTRGIGIAKEKLSSFENALRDARIAHLNLVTVSSYFSAALSYHRHRSRCRPPGTGRNHPLRHGQGTDQ